MHFYSRQNINLSLTEIIKLFPLVFKEKDKNLKSVFETSFKKKIGVKHCILINSLRSGLEKTIEFYRLKHPKKNEIIIPEYSHFSNLNAILKNNCHPIIVPVNTKTLNIDENKIEKFISKKTLGILLTHMHGYSCNMDKIMKIADKSNLIVFEDCAHAHFASFKGKKLGSFGIGCFSFGFGKILTCLGGGAIVSHDKKLITFLKKNQIENSKIFSKNLRSLLKLVSSKILTDKFFGFFFYKPILSFFIKKNIDYKLTEKVFVDSKKSSLLPLTPMQIQAGIFQLDKVDDENKKRINIAKIYNHILRKNKVKNGDVCFHYLIKVKNSKTAKTKMLKFNVDLQDDYCQYLPSLYPEINQNVKNPFEKIMYLPTTPYIDPREAKKIAVRL